MRRSSGTSAILAAIACCTSNAQRTALTTLGNYTQASMSIAGEGATAGDPMLTRM
jgi:hypothetical protein